VPCPAALSLLHKEQELSVQTGSPASAAASSPASPQDTEEVGRKECNPGDGEALLQIPTYTCIASSAL